MKLQRGGTDGRGDGAFDGFGDSGGFGFAGSKNQDASRIENCADAHGDGTFGNFGALREKATIIFDGFLREFLQPSARGEAGVWFVETDVSVAADAENLEIDAAGVFDGAFVFVTIGGIIFAERTVGDVNFVRRKVHL